MQTSTSQFFYILSSTEKKDKMEKLENEVNGKEGKKKVTNLIDSV
jgi:hypothetical protein